MCHPKHSAVVIAADAAAADAVDDDAKSLHSLTFT